MFVVKEQDYNNIAAEVKIFETEFRSDIILTGTSSSACLFTLRDFS